MAPDGLFNIVVLCHKDGVSALLSRVPNLRLREPGCHRVAHPRLTCGILPIHSLLSCFVLYPPLDRTSDLPVWMPARSSTVLRVKEGLRLGYKLGSSGGPKKNRGQGGTHQRSQVSVRGHPAASSVLGLLSAPLEQVDLSSLLSHADIHTSTA